MHRLSLPIAAVVLFSAAVVAVGSSESPAGAGTPDSDIVAHSTGTSLPAGVIASGDRVAYQLAEAEAGTDLNGDGDQLDVVMQLLHVPTKTITNTELAVVTQPYAGFDFAGDTLVVLVDEEAQGNTDLNEDGDLEDAGYAVYNAATGVTTHLGVGSGDLQGDEPYSWSGLSDGGHLMCIPVPEWSNGDTDLNGDGDAHDLVVHVWDVSAGTMTNLGYYPSFTPAYCRVTDEVAVFDLVEAVEGDLNGDFDTDDRFAHVFTAATGSVTRLASPGWTDVANTYVGQERPESGVDLNGDGDGIDSVAFVFDATSGTMHNTALAGTPQLWAATVAISVPETAQGGSDLNGDGDSADQVVHLYDVQSKSIDNTQVVGRVAAAGDGFLVVGTPTGVNWSDALSVYDTSERTEADLAETSLEFFRVTASGNLVAFAALEVRYDLNGDGDTADMVAHVYDHSDASMVNLGHAIPIGGMGISDKLVVFGVDEERDGGVDLNGDGDAVDVVVQLADTSTNRSATTGYGLLDDWYMPSMGNGFVAVGVNESSDGATDHNGDGDALDDVLFTFSMVPPNVDPVADAGGPYVGEVGVPVTFSSSGSIDPDGTIVAYQWTFGDGNTSTSAEPTHAYAADGTYSIGLTVTDDDGATNVAVTEAVISEPVVVVEDPFVDDDDSVFEADIEWLAAEGITKGCNPPHNDKFCPESYVTRSQMAAFLVRALDLTEQLDDPFVDDDDSIFEADIEKLAAAGITKGCNPSEGNTKFCPSDRVTRGQMAAFLVRAMGYTDDGGGDLFIDDDNSIFEHDIDCLGTAGVTRGCNPGDGNTKYCPESNVTRGQMAAFLHRALGD